VFEELINSPERDKAIEVLSQRSLPFVHSLTMHLSPLWPYHPDTLKDIEGVFFRIMINEKTGRFEQSQPGYYFAT
jgi:uncharacterized protein